MDGEDRKGRGEENQGGTSMLGGILEDNHQCRRYRRLLRHKDRRSLDRLDSYTRRFHCRGRIH